MSMSAAELRAQLAALGFSQRGFACYLRVGERTVRHRVNGDVITPRWVPVVRDLIRRVGPRTAKSAAK